jgi:hypothetical protein
LSKSDTIAAKVFAVSSAVTEPLSVSLTDSVISSVVSFAAFLERAASVLTSHY